MRLGLIVVLCLLNAGCAIVAQGRGRTRRQRAAHSKGRAGAQTQRGAQAQVARDREPDHRPLLRARHLFPGRGHHRAARSIRMRPSPAARCSAARTTSASTTRSTRGAWSSTSAWRERNHVRIDYFKLNRFNEQPLPRDIIFGDFSLRRRHELPHQARLARAVAHLHVFGVQVRALRRRRWASASTLSKRRPKAASPARSTAKRPPRSASSRPCRERWRSAFPSAGRSRRAASSSRRLPRISTARCPTTMPTSSFAGARTSPFGLGYSRTGDRPRRLRHRPAAAVQPRHQRSGAVLPRELLSPRPFDARLSGIRPPAEWSPDRAARRCGRIPACATATRRGIAAASAAPCAMGATLSSSSCTTSTGMRTLGAAAATEMASARPAELRRESRAQIGAAPAA